MVHGSRYVVRFTVHSIDRIADADAVGNGEPTVGAMILSIYIIVNWVRAGKGDYGVSCVLKTVQLLLIIRSNLQTKLICLWVEAPVLNYWVNLSTWPLITIRAFCALIRCWRTILEQGLFRCV